MAGLLSEPSIAVENPHLNPYLETIRMGGVMAKEMNRSDIAGIIDAISWIAKEYCEQDLPKDKTDRLAAEIDLRKAMLELAFENRRTSERPQGPADSNVYFAEKLGGLITFARMAIKATDRENYECPKIKDNVRHYAYLVAGLVDAH